MSAEIPDGEFDVPMAENLLPLQLDDVDGNVLRVERSNDQVLLTTALPRGRGQVTIALDADQLLELVDAIDQAVDEIAGPLEDSDAS